MIYDQIVISARIKECIAWVESQTHTKWVCLGRGDRINRGTLEHFVGLCYSLTDPSFRVAWCRTDANYKNLLSMRSYLYYFAPLDSDIARLNGHAPSTIEIKKKIKL